MFLDVRFGPNGLVNVLGMHGLAEGIGDPLLEFVRRDMEGTSRSGPPELERAVHDPSAPRGGEIAKVTGVLRLALGVAFLDERPEALAVDEEVATSSVIIGN